MVELFKRCLNAKYISTPESGNYSIEVEGNILYLLFEWSSGAEDWKNNFDFPTKPYKNGKRWLCHRGFLRVWKAMLDEIEAYVAERLKFHAEVTKIVCVGYSHGGALCALATEDMVYLYGDKYAVSGYGFGAPRIAWGFLPKEVKRRFEHYTTIRNSCDIVTHLPPIAFGFRNVGVLKKIGKYAKYNPIKAHYDTSYILELAIDNAENVCYNSSEVKQ